MWEPDPLVEDWKTRRRIRRAVVLLGLVAWVGCMAFARWQAAPTPCERARNTLCDLTWRCDLADELVSVWDEPTCDAVLASVELAERSGSWSDTLCAALAHLPAGSLHGSVAPQHAATVEHWSHDRCWWRPSSVGAAPDPR